MDHVAKLIEGFRRFRETYFQQRGALFRDLVTEGQAPKVMVIACSDSRVDPAIITGAGPGDLFVVRNVANLVPPYEPDAHYHGTSAALEFAVRGLAVEEIIVLGHACCGGIQALMTGRALSPEGGRGRSVEFISSWVAIAERALQRIPGEQAAAVPDAAAPDAAVLDEAARRRALEQAAIAVSLENLMTFPWVHARVGDGRLRLHGWYFDMESGALLGRDPDSGEFEVLC